MQYQIFFTEYPLALILGTGLLGLLIGSFLNVVIYRVPKMLEQEWRCGCYELLEQEPPNSGKEGDEEKTEEKFNLVTPASCCPGCQRPIKPWENIPVVSYLLLKGRCAGCANPISKRYPSIELVTAIISAALAYYFGFGWQLAGVLVFSWALISLTMIDIDTQLLPDNITLPLLWLGLIVNSQSLYIPLSDAFWGAVFGYLSLWSVYQLFKQLTGKEGMGYGDFKLLAALGAWMGWQALPLIILLSSVVGAVLGIAGILIMGRDKNIPIPFGPYLAIAGFLNLLFGDAITSHYLSLFSQ